MWNYVVDHFSVESKESLLFYLSFYDTYFILCKNMWPFLLSIFALFHLASASGSFDFGDTLALILGLIIGIMGFFACMGAYARRRNHFESLWSWKRYLNKIYGKH